MKATIVYGDDWMGLYFDGRLVAEDHSLRAWQVLEALQIPVDNISADCDWLHEVGNLPSALADVVREYEGN